MTPEEDAELEVQNDAHRAVSSLEELIPTALDFDMSKELWCYKSATEVLQVIGIDHPTNTQCRECGRVLRDRYGAPKKIDGFFKWKIPLKPTYTP